MFPNDLPVILIKTAVYTLSGDNVHCPIDWRISIDVAVKLPDKMADLSFAHARARCFLWKILDILDSGSGGISTEGKGIAHLEGFR